MSKLSYNPEYWKEYEEKRLGTPSDTDAWNYSIRHKQVDDILNEVKRLMENQDTILDEADLNYIRRLI